jgi:hypothetical protein
MPTFKIAHINQDNVDLIIVPLEASFGSKSSSDQRDAIIELQTRAQAAGLRGGVVPVWDAGLNRMAYIAPDNWKPFFNSINLQWVSMNINRDLSW